MVPQREVLNDLGDVALEYDELKTTDNRPLSAPKNTDEAPLNLGLVTSQKEAKDRR